MGAISTMWDKERVVAQEEWIKAALLMPLGAFPTTAVEPPEVFWQLLRTCSLVACIHSSAAMLRTLVSCGNLKKYSKASLNFTCEARFQSRICQSRGKNGLIDVKWLVRRWWLSWGRVSVLSGLSGGCCCVVLEDDAVAGDQVCLLCTSPQQGCSGLWETRIFSCLMYICGHIWCIDSCESVFCVSVGL